MRVAVVVNCLKLGGMERVAVNLADAFSSNGHDSHLIYLKDRPIKVKPQNIGVTLHLFNLKKWVFSTVIGVFWFVVCRTLNVVLKKTFPHFFAYATAIAFHYKLKKLERKIGKFDLIVFRGQGTFGQVWPLKDCRFVFVCESIQNKWLYSKLSKSIFSDLFEGRNVVCVSEGAKDSFVNLTLEHNISCKKILKISNPNDYKRIKNEAMELIVPPLVHPRPYILGLGRLVPLKNFSLLINAYHDLKINDLISQDLVIVGDGKDRGTLEKLVQELNLTDSVFFKGSQTNPFPWYKNADLFVLSSQSEGLGMVLIEALACNTKVVATNCPGGVSEIMKGELVNFLCEQDIDDMAKKIQFALGYKVNCEFEECVNKVLEQFDQDVIVEQYQQSFSI